LTGVKLVTSDAHAGLVAAIGATLLGAANYRLDQSPLLVGQVRRIRARRGGRHAFPTRSQRLCLVTLMKRL